MPKCRLNQLVAVEAECNDHDDDWIKLRPMVLPGGINAKHNMLAYLDACRQHIPDVEWHARIVYHWRSKNHLMRWIRRGNSFRGKSP